MIDLFRPDQVRAMDQRAFATGVDSLALMERAAGHLARAILDVADHTYGLRVGILCGKGNNGGDGLAAARLLLDAGAAPVVHLIAGEDQLTGDAADQLRRWRAAGGRVAASPDEALARASIGVDCLLGTGASGEPRPPYDVGIEALRGFPGRVVACDLPSGVDADTGRVPGAAVQADVTVTLGAHKRGLWLWPARGYAGDLVLGDLDIIEANDEPAARVLDDAAAGRLVPEPPPGSHKRNRGVVVILAGSSGMSGAAVLCARGALAAGAGLVTVATAPLARHLVAPGIPEALTIEVPEDDPDTAFERVAGACERADGLAVGPGLGHGQPQVALIRRLVAELDVPLVLDADGINVYRHEGKALAEHASPGLVLTPHAQEFARLITSSGHGAGEGERSEPGGRGDVGEGERSGPGGRGDIWAKRVALVPDCAREWDTTIVAKGPGSMIAAPDGRVWVNPTGSAALATGGTGDVLTGMTVALLAQDPQPPSVAASVYVHGLAGEIAAQRASARSVTALDVARAVPAAVRRVQDAVP